MNTVHAYQDNALDNARPGDGATFVLHTDCHAGTIVAKTARLIVWQRDKATLLNGVDSGEPDALRFSPGGFVGHTSGHQRYRYDRDEDGLTRKFSRRRNGRWVRVGLAMNTRGCYLIAGRREHYDFNY